MTFDNYVGGYEGRTTVVRFTVYGTASPAGSKTSGVKKDGGRFVRDSNPASAAWKGEVKAVAGKLMERADGGMLLGPLTMSLEFYRARPGNHYKSDGKTLSKKGEETPYPISRPDSTKLTRGVEDAMTGIVYRDDSQIVQQIIKKWWGTPARVEVTLSVIPT